MDARLISLLKTLLVLGRVSNLPTVWSNCLAGWLLGGGGSIPSLGLTAVAASLLYVGGMYLNDAFDADFDRAHRAARPIPKGEISERTVWSAGFGMLLLGWLLLTPLGIHATILGLLLTCSIVLYDAVHKSVAFSPILMAICRVLLFLLACSVGQDGITGLGTWSALALGCWIVGLSYIAKRESLSGSPIQMWPLGAMAVPLLLAFLTNPGYTRTRALLLSLLLIAWTWRSLRFTFGGPSRQVGRTVSCLLAGICLVDLLAVTPSFGYGLIFAGLFTLSLLFQHYVPAT
jgi:hypothetical protein